jgi:hypothetical protein
MLIGETLLGLRLRMYSIISIALVSVDDVYISTHYNDNDCKLRSPKGGRCFSQQCRCNSWRAGGQQEGLQYNGEAAW